MTGGIVRGALKRRLAGIVSLDVVGYSRLMHLDEAATHTRVRTLLDDLVLPLIARFNGETFKTTGDGVLAAFESVAEATACAVVIQQSMRQRAEDAGPHRIQFRIGIHFGEVIVEPDDLYGEAINITVRVEALAEPGGICVSSSVADLVRDQISLDFESMGRRELKNIDRSVDVFRVRVPDQPLDAALAGPAQRSPLLARNILARPAIAVLPFSATGASRSVRYVAGGLTDSLTTRLSQLRAFPVISRGSSFNLKSRRRDPVEIGARLGALYLLEGAVQTTSDRVRVSVRLLESAAGQTIFSERFDRVLSDVFLLQDEITTSVIGAISPELVLRESERFARRSGISADAYELYQRGIWHHHRYTRQDSEKAVAYFGAALAADPGSSAAAAALSISLVHAAMSGWLDASRFGDAEDLALTALAADSRDPQAHFALGIARYHLGKIRPALLHLEDAIGYNPSHAAAYANMAFILNYLDEPTRALENAQLAFRLSPTDPRLFIWSTALSAAHYLLGDYDAAVAAGERGLGMRRDYLHTARYVVAALGQLGRADELATYLPLLRELDGSADKTAATLGKVYVPHALARILEGLRKAGFD
jgi:adenylate cyclase